MIFELRRYDETLLSFDYQAPSLDRERASIIWVNERARHLLPIGMELSEDGIISWLKSRVIPKNRQFVDAILSNMGLSSNNAIGIIRICKGLSLNDSYWVVEQGFQGKFEKYNLFKNNFTRTLSLIAYTGYGSMTAKGFTSSPEFTTNGMLKKCWRREKGKIYLYKGGSSGAANTGKEPYSEFYASQIAATMGLNHVDYNLKKWKGVLSSVCELFTDIDTAYVPIWRFAEGTSLIEIADKLKEFGEEVYNQFVDMLVFDALIYNVDRHAGNFGLLIDGKTNTVKGFAPIFDNGLSLFYSAMDEDLLDIEKYSAAILPAIGGSFNEIVKRFITERQRSKLRKMINFKFKKHPRYNLAEKRLKTIEKFLQVRVRELLEL